MAIAHGGDLFAIAREHGWDWRDVLDFSASINPLGPSPKVRPAICAALDRIAHYPERDSPCLRQALADQWEVNKDRIVLGNGATELIFFVARLFDRVTLALPVFSEFHRAFPHARTASLTDRSTWPDEGLLVLTRPANPTGWTLPLEALRDVKATVLIDESFLEFSGQPSAAAFHPNVLVLRSLTKFYALAGLRIGALVGEFDRSRREPWQVNVLAEAAALAAVSDTDHAARSIEFVAREREYLAAQLGALPSDANFLFIPLAYQPARLKAHLLQYKILIRDDPEWSGVRVAVRTRAENNRLIAAWREFRP